MKSVTRLPSRMVKLFSDSDNDEDAHAINFTRRYPRYVPAAGMQYGDPQFSLNLSSQLRIFRVNYDKKK
jgi:hypothetical protein